MLTNEFIQCEKNFEGFRSKSYLCPSMHLTVGYGHRTNKPIVIDEDTATQFLKSDLLLAHTQLKNKYKWYSSLQNHEQLAFIDLVFNIGFGNFCKSSFDKKIKMFYPQNKQVIADHFNRFIYANGKILSGLIKRRMFCYNLFMYNRYSTEPPKK